MKRNILVYTMENCHFCVEQKKWMKERDVIFQERDINNPKYFNEFINLDGQSTPTTVVKDSENNLDLIIVGFNEEKLKNELL